MRLTLAEALATLAKARAGAMTNPTQGDTQVCPEPTQPSPAEPDPAPAPSPTLPKPDNAPPAGDAFARWHVRDGAGKLLATVDHNPAKPARAGLCRYFPDGESLYDTLAYADAEAMLDRWRDRGYVVLYSPAN